MSIDVSKKLVNQRRNQYINKTFEDFRNDLIDYARTNFSNQIQDFSESSLGGMLLDFAAIVGDSLSFYVEQQFSELSYETATNTSNIVKHLRKAGVKGGNASPSSVYVTFFIETNIESGNVNDLMPVSNELPIIKAGTTLRSDDGINFILSEDVDFTSGYKKEVAEEDENGQPLTLLLEKKGLCTSGILTSETVTFDSDENNLFLSYNLSNINVQNIVKVTDSDLNEYYEVEFLSQNTVYLKVEDSKENYLYPTAAPFRYTVERNFQNSTSTLRFGNGSGKTIEDNILTNPEDLLVPLKNRNYSENISLDPHNLITSNSLGVSPAGKTVTISYIHGGGEDHNVAAGSIETIVNPIMVFPNIADSVQDIDTITASVIESLDAFNEEEAVGGTNALTLEELRLQIPNTLVAQNRIVNEKDLISRIYTMPSDYGKVHKIALLENQFTNLSKDLFVICKNNQGFYIHANDALKMNLKNFINNFRVLGDSFNILDAPIYNFNIDLTIKVKSSFVVENVLDNVISRVIQNMRFDTLQINEAINVNDIINIVLNTDGVSSIVTLPENIIGSKSFQDDFFDEEEEEDIEYSNNSFSPRQQFQDGFIYPLRGGIFEFKHSNYDIVVRNG
tara:strand:- start:275 stop:2134 length:1860 start_codon:yes stop_codon:yes gene_type:complete